MFWKNKKVVKEEENPQLKDDEIDIKPPIFKREIWHIKSTIDGKLYDTGKSELLSYFKNDRFLFKTQKGNYFSCKVQNESCRTIDSYLSTIVYYDIRPKNIENAKKVIGKYDVDRYIELFGEPEEA